MPRDNYWVVRHAFWKDAELKGAVERWCVDGKCTDVSDERGHAAMLDHLGAKPLLDLGMRLGEGSGAALAVPLVRAAADFLCDMASFESAGITDRR